MINPALRILLVINLAILGGIVARPAVLLLRQPVQPDAAKPAVDNAELARMYEEDQADRKPAGGKSIDWSVVNSRDKAREKRAKEIYQSDGLRTGADYYHVAMILQHAELAEDYLLAHELCIVAIAKGEENAKWLAAATEDRFLMNIGRPQRFATQYRSDGPNAEFKLYTVGPGVTDELRRALNVPTLAKAKEREAAFNQKPKSKQ